MLNAAAALTVSSSAPPPPDTTETPAGASKLFTSTTEAATTNGPAWRKVTIEGKAPGAGKNGGDITMRREAGFYFPPRNEAPGYDDDGDLTQDGRWHYERDAENRPHTECPASFRVHLFTQRRARFENVAPDSALPQPMDATASRAINDGTTRSRAMKSGEDSTFRYRSKKLSSSRSATLR